MNTVTFRTEEANFQFDKKAVMDLLEHRKTLYEIKELDLLLDVISSQPDQTVLSSAGHHYFGFILLDLILAGKGSVTCKNCGKRYSATQLVVFTVGSDDVSYEVYTGKQGKFKNLFRKRPKLPGMYGGKGYKCPRGHTLIFMVTWRT